MIDSELRWTLGTVIVAYVAVMYAIAWWASRRVVSVDDFLVAGRRLPLSLAWMTLLATWFGAGTMLAVPDEVRVQGLRAVALDPLGAGFCLLFVGAFVAGPMWREQLLTVPQFFGRRFGPLAETVSACLLVPSYFGWIAAQFVAVAGMLHYFFDLDERIGLVLAALVGGGYTLLGGMWSVTLTDAVQLGLALLGLAILSINVLLSLGSGDVLIGATRIVSGTEADKLVVIPTESRRELVTWFGLFVVGSLGNVPAQDLMQRVFAAKSERTARRACFAAGGAYLAFGSLPVLLALAADQLLVETPQQGTLAALAHLCMSPALAVIFVVSLLSIVLSTIDSAILSPAGIIAQDLCGRFLGGNALRWNRGAVALVTLCSLGVALQGESAYGLLEQAYSLTLVGLFVPLMMGIYRGRPHGIAANASMLAGGLAWALHLTLGWDDFVPPLGTLCGLECPMSLGCTLVSLIAYLVAERVAPGEISDVSL
ncbi:MAG: sodium:solute symporter family protein [Planctomycetales bacterium]|nr:sodium:solute symporter family protein [Planctomycetales bacterium]